MATPNKNTRTQRTALGNLDLSAPSLNMARKRSASKEHTDSPSPKKLDQRESGTSEASHTTTRRPSTGDRPWERSTTPPSPTFHERWNRYRGWSMERMKNWERLMWGSRGMSPPPPDSPVNSDNCLTDEDLHYEEQSKENNRKMAAWEATWELPLKDEAEDKAREQNEVEPTEVHCKSIRGGLN